MENVSHWRVIEGTSGETVPFPSEMHPRLAAALRARGIEDLYTHQAEAWETIRACVSDDEFHLVEALATRVANVMLARYAVVEWVTVRVSKPAALASRGVGSVGVQLTVRRDGAGG